jgi:hypothetical protein
MTAILQLAGFLAVAWLLSVVVDRCYRGRLPREPRALRSVAAGGSPAGHHGRPRR